jgi:hypothetical protein
MDKHKDKQEVDIGFVQKWIPQCGMLNQRVYKNFKHPRWVVAEKTARKICYTPYGQMHGQTGSWHQNHTKMNPKTWHAKSKSLLQF